MIHKLKIMQIAPIFYNLSSNMDYGGTERVVYSLDKELSKLGHESHVVATGGSKINGHLHVSRETPLWGEKQTTDSSKNQREIEGHMANVLNYVDKINPDVIHDHTGRLLATNNYKMVRDSLNYPILTTLHSPAEDPRKKDIYEAYRERNSREFFCTISESQRDLFSSLVHVDGVVYNGLDVENYPFSEEKSGYLFSLGRLKSNKGQHDAILVARALRKDLIIAGIVPDVNKGYYEKVIKPMLGEGISFIGELSEEDKKPYYANASAFLMPIHWDEPFGLVMIESMATGTPVIAYDRGSVPEIINDGKTGFIVEDLESMIEATRNIGNINPRECRQHVKENFSTRKQAKNYLNLYDKVRSIVKSQNLSRKVS